jgi:hypothetical protein
MTMKFNASHTEIARLIDQRIAEGMKIEDLEAGMAKWQRGLRARERVKELTASEDFQARFARKDPEALKLWRTLSLAQAEADDAAMALYGPDAERDGQAEEALRQEVQALATNPEFMERFNRGDADAVEQYRSLSIGKAAAVVGVDPNTIAPAPAAPSPQPGAGES